MLGLMAAMPEEINALVRRIDGVGEGPTVRVERARRVFTRGRLCGREVVAVCSRWGKTAAASTATELIVSFGVERVVFSGIAGGVAHGVHVGDVVVARSLAHHDLDASPFFPPGHVPLLGVKDLPTDEAMSAGLLDAATAFLLHDAAASDEASLWARVVATRARGGAPAACRALRGDVASGDRVISSGEQRATVLRAVPTALCVEMEGAAAAQVCYEHGVRFACVRTISDSADEHLDASVVPFFAGVAGAYTEGIVTRWLEAGGL